MQRWRAHLYRAAVRAVTMSIYRTGALSSVPIAVLLLLTAQQLPAPISEVQATPGETTAPAKSKAAPTKRKSEEVSETNSARRLDGTWRWTYSWKAGAGNTFNATGTLVIQHGGSAELTSEYTSTLGPGATWPGYPAPYNSISPVYTKVLAKSVVMKPEGSNLRIQWAAAKLADWAPKTIPYGVVTGGHVNQPKSILYIPSGNSILATDGKTTATWTRAR